MAQPTFVSLYSGAGGLDLGFHRAGYIPVWANDIDASAVATYNKVFARLVPGHRAHLGDIREQDLPKRGAADIVVGGPPCQGFSVAGRMDPTDPRSRHVWDFLGVVARVRPQAFVMENVKNLAINDRWASLRESLTEEAASLGYRPTWLILNSADYGVPQARERMFLIGTRDGAIVKPTPVTDEARPTVGDALKNLPPLGTAGNDSVCPAKVTPARKPVLRRSPFAGMLFNGQGRPLNLEAPALTLPASMGGNRTPIIDQQQLETGAECWVIRYHQHLWNGGAPYKRIPKRLRRLTVEEAAAIQTFPKDMEWEGRQTAQYRQIGNAVPPTLAYHVALALREAIDVQGPSVATGHRPRERSADLVGTNA